MYVLYGAHSPFCNTIWYVFSILLCRAHRHIYIFFCKTSQIYWNPLPYFATAYGTHIFTVLSPSGLPCFCNCPWYTHIYCIEPPHCHIFATGHSTRILSCIEPISVCICICNSFSSSSPPLLTVGLRQEGGFSGPGLLRERGEGEGGLRGRWWWCIRRDGISREQMHTARWDITESMCKLVT